MFYDQRFDQSLRIKRIRTDSSIKRCAFVAVCHFVVIAVFYRKAGRREKGGASFGARKSSKNGNRCHLEARVCKED